jgi:hypothetical protein
MLNDRRHVLGICFPQREDHLIDSTQEFCGRFSKNGFVAELANLGTPEGVALFERRLFNNELAFCFGFQGVGSGLKFGDQNLWTCFRVPFLGLNFESACYNPSNQANESPFVASLYGFESLLDVRRRFFDVPQLTGLIPFDTYEPIPKSQLIEFASRPIRFLYLKSGGSLENCVDNINSLTPPIRNAVWQQLERTVKNPNLELCDLAEEIFQAIGYNRRDHEGPFWAVVQYMDRYIRTWRSHKFVNWLKFQEGALIIGDGWDMIDREGVRAKFCPSVSIANVNAMSLFRQTQFICNTNPYKRDITHERVINGLLYHCCVLTDSNMWWDRHFADIHALMRFDWDRPLDDQLHPAINDIHKAAEAAEAGATRATQYFTGNTCCQRIVDYAEDMKDPDNSEAKRQAAI